MSLLCRQLRHEVTKKAIKAALKLCAGSPPFNEQVWLLFYEYKS